MDGKTYTSVVSEHRSFIMGLSMFSIMLFHQYFTSVLPLNIFHNLGHWGVDVFLFLSGMGLVNSLQKYSTEAFYKRRFIRIFPSCMICGISKYIIFLLICSYISNIEEKIDLNLWSIASFDLWFIPTIIVLYIIAPVLYCLFCKWPILSFSFIVMVFFLNDLTLRPVVGFDWMSPIGVLSWTTERLPVFSAGMIVSIYSKKIEVKLRISLLFLFSAVCVKFLEKNGVFFSGINACIFLLLTLGMPGLIMLCVRIINILPTFIKPSVSFFGIYSLELYLVHEFIFWIFMMLFPDGKAWALLPLCFLLSCLSAFLCKNFVERLIISK